MAGSEMDLRTRLARLDTLTGKSRRDHLPAPDPLARQAHLAALIREMELEPAVSGAGGVYVRRRGFDLPAPGFGGRDLAGLFTTVPDPDLEAGDLLFLDVETTGLAGGTGTLAFLVGLAWWEGDRFLVEQVFLTEPDRERDLLDRVAGAATGRRALVTFNGGSFDLPLLRTRVLVNRRRDFLSGLASLDLMVPARRFWGRTLPDCRQQTLERLICGLERGPGDIPGSDIPAVWFAFLRGEDDPRMAAVLRHNERDMKGMALVWRALLRWMAFADGSDLDRVEQPSCPWSQTWSLARISALRNNGPRVDHWLGRTLDHLMTVPAAAFPDSSQRRGFWRDAVTLAKRRRNWPLLRRVLEAGLMQKPDAVWLHREAAILHEYRLGDLDSALVHAFQCQEERRILRLQRRMPGPRRL